MKGRVLEEYVFYEALGYLCLYTLAGADKVAQRQVILHHYERTRLLLAHVQASHQYRHYGFAVITIVFLKCVGCLGLEETPQAVYPLVGAYGVEEMADFLLEEDNDGYGTHTDQLVQYAAKQFHLQYLADKNPDADEDQHTVEDVHGARLLHQLVAEEQEYGHKENVYKVLQSEIKHCRYIFIASTASLTSCTRSMDAPFISAMVFSAVVPFRDSSGVVSSRR